MLPKLAALALAALASFALPLSASPRPAPCPTGAVLPSRSLDDARRLSQACAVPILIVSGETAVGRSLLAASRSAILRGREPRAVAWADGGRSLSLPSGVILVGLEGRIDEIIRDTGGLARLLHHLDRGRF